MDRYKKHGWGRTSAPVESSTPIDVQKSHPLHRSFQPPSLPTTGHIMRYLLATQQVAYGYTILNTFTHAIIMRNLKLLLKKYDRDMVIAGILLSVHRSKYPSSTKFIEECIHECISVTRTSEKTM